MGHDLVLVLYTGRCGSVSFAKACKHISGWTAGHETNAGKLGPGRLVYPRHHIEVDNRLSWFLGRLDELYGASVFYVHLKRNSGATVQSFAKRASGPIMTAYRHGIYLKAPKTVLPEDVARDYVCTVEANISLFLKDKLYLTVQTEHMARGVYALAEHLEAPVDMDAARKTLEVHYNAG